MNRDPLSLIETVLRKNIELFIAEKHLRHACLYSVLAGGKRLRPQLVLEVARLFGGNENHALEVGAAVEFIHCYSLIHDDLPAMDDDDLRRGRPTLHKKYNDATAILAGDALLTMAFEVLSEETAHPDPMIRCQMIKHLSSAAGGSGMVQGQYEDMKLTPHFNAEDQDHIIAMQANKTGALIAVSCVLGALAAGQSHDTILDTIQKYGFHIGTAFQLKDDLLDIESTSAALGKNTGKDSAAGKATLPALIGQEKSYKLLSHHIEMAQMLLEGFSAGKDSSALSKLTSFVRERNC